VVDGHTLCVSAGLGGEVAREDLISAWRAFRGAPQELELPSAPRRPTAYLDDPDGPQPRLHADLERGMACVVGRLRPCPLLGWKFVAVTHNTLRGAALGSILLAELAVARGLVPPE
jgi:aspartate-semialdehyde dehydrogenase